MALQSFFVSIYIIGAAWQQVFLLDFRLLSGYNKAISQYGWKVGVLVKNIKRGIFIKTVIIALLGVTAAAIFFFIGKKSPQAPAWPGKELPMLPSTAEQTEFTAEFTLPMLALEDARPLLRNPDRGLRMETYITLGAPESYPGNPECPYEKMLGFIEKYEEESPVLVQLYVYLTRYSEKPLDGIAFAQLRQMLELLRDNGVRALLRFTYQNESNPDAAWPQVREHLNQIGAWFRQNSQLVEGTLYAVQGGIIGNWGEGHNNINFKNRYIGPAFDLLCRITPADVFVQVRNIDLMGMVSPKFKNRIGMHDDYMIGEPDGMWNFFLGRGGKRESRAEAGFWRTINDGEMPWGVATYYDRPDGHLLDSMDVMPILRQFKQYSMTSFSLEHNYREDVPGRRFSMDRWRDEHLALAQLEQAGLPCHPSLFDLDDNINTFDYIRYHLGYLLSVTSFERNKNQVRFTIQNNGFAAPLNFNALSLVIEGGEYLVGSYDKFALASMQAVTYTVDLPENFDSSQAIGIKLARRAGSPLSARFMNDTEFADGASILRQFQ